MRFYQLMLTGSWLVIILLLGLRGPWKVLLPGVSRVVAWLAPILALVCAAWLASRIFGDYGSMMARMVVAAVVGLAGFAEWLRHKRETDRCVLVDELAFEMAQMDKKNLEYMTHQLRDEHILAKKLLRKRFLMALYGADDRKQTKRKIAIGGTKNDRRAPVKQEVGHA